MKGLESMRASAWVAWVVAASLAEIAAGAARTVRFCFRREMERERIRRILLGGSGPETACRREAGRDREGLAGAREPEERAWDG
ncbi:MAG: hypothetical protein JXP34_04865 [Planctomycetes bacterium]|nr:hypothetical protein [Planctomycetota bacterium]